MEKLIIWQVVFQVWSLKLDNNVVIESIKPFVGDNAVIVDNLCVQYKYSIIIERNKWRWCAPLRDKDEMSVI